MEFLINRDIMCREENGERRDKVIDTQMKKNKEGSKSRGKGTAGQQMWRGSQIGQRGSTLRIHVEKNASGGLLIKGERKGFEEMNLGRIRN